MRSRVSETLGISKVFWEKKYNHFRKSHKSYTRGDQRADKVLERRKRIYELKDYVSVWTDNNLTFVILSNFEMNSCLPDAKSCVGSPWNLEIIVGKTIS